MKKLLLLMVALSALLPIGIPPPPSHAQTKVDTAVGVVVDTDQSNRKLFLKTDAGPIISVQVDENVACLRLPAGERTLTKAAPIKFEEIAKGDRLLAHGTKSDQVFVAQRLIVMPVAEVAKKRERDLDEWKRRGIGGIVREVNASTGEVALELRGPSAGTRLGIETTKANFRRYVAGSLRFEEARASNLNEVHVGDQLRALGDKSPDGRTFVAEQIVSGAFKTIGAAVTEIDPARNEIHATTLDQKKPIVIIVNQDSVFHRISAPVAATIAQRAKAEASKPATPQSAPGPKTAASPVIDVQQLIDTLPAMSLADLKAGDVLAVTGAVESDDSHLVAIKVASGVDLVLKALAPAPGKAQVVRLSAGLPSVFDFSVIPVN